MPPIANHPGAHENSNTTASEYARINAYDAIQLYVSQDFLVDEAQDRIIANIVEAGIKQVVIHLPNFENLTDKEIEKTESFIDKLPENVKWRALIHFGGIVDGVQSVIPFERIPLIKGRPVCIENSKTGIYDPSHVASAFQLSRILRSGFVFDIGRILYPDDRGIINPEEVYKFITAMIYQMDPERDLIHAAGKTDWIKRFREAPSAFGEPDDITAPLKSILLAFHNAGGVIVFEHEDVGMIEKSRNNLLS